MKKLALSLAFVLVSSFAVGQVLTKEQIKEQKKQKNALLNMVRNAEAKISVDPVGVSNAIKPAIINPLVNKEAYVWFVSTSAKKAAIDNENRKRAEGADYNEPMLYSYVYGLGNDITTLEKCDNTPDEKGRVKPKYTEFVNMTLSQEFRQFFNAGAYYYNQSEFLKGYELFGMYVNASDKLAALGLISDDTANTSLASFYMVLSGRQMEDNEKVLANVERAMTNPEFAEQAFRLKTAAYLEMGDTVAWLDLCKEGLVKFPNDAYHSQSLIQYYDENNKSEELDKLADDLIASDPENALYIYLKGYIAGQKEDYNTAVEWYKKTLEVDPEYEGAMANLANCYIRLAQKYSAENSSTKLNDKKKIAEDKKVLEGYYRSALPLLEELRVNFPDRHNLWLTNLTLCYYNLNMNKQADELMKLQNELAEEGF